jgi:Zn-dependent protease with chaperone function
MSHTTQFWITIAIHMIGCVGPFWMLSHWFVKRGNKLMWQNWQASLRGAAHTALRSATRLMTRQQWANIGTIPLTVMGSSRATSANLARNSIITNTPLMMLAFKRQFELAADYFGIQYLYKAGYSTYSFTDVVQRIWPSTKASADAFSLFPPT